jgi:tRNA(Ile)-lysidine synthase
MQAPPDLGDAAALSAWAERDSLEAPVVVACSGGPDSLALLAIAASALLKPVAVHVDHGLREGSSMESKVVEDAANLLGVEWQSILIDVGNGPNLEARARAARYSALANLRADLGATVILTGHTADDVAETVLINTLRGSGLSGLAGIPRRNGYVVRPLLDMRREDVRAVAMRLEVTPVDDPSNSNEIHRRNWIRHTVMPLLSEGAGRDLVPLLARQAAVLSEDAALLDALADELLSRAGSDEPDVRILRDAPHALSRRALRRWIGPPWPSLADLARIESVVTGAIRATEIEGGIRISRREGHLRRGVSSAPVTQSNEQAKSEGVQ